MNNIHSVGDEISINTHIVLFSIERKKFVRFKEGHGGFDAKAIDRQGGFTKIRYLCGCEYLVLSDQVQASNMTRVRECPKCREELAGVVEEFIEDAD